MSVTLGLMAASAAYSAYNNYKASEAQQESLAQQQAFHREYLEELGRRNEINESLALRDTEKIKSQVSVSAAALGQSTGDVSTLAHMEEVTALSMEQILRDRQESEWEMRAAEFKGEAMADQMASERSAQKTQLFGDLLGAGYQASKYYDSGLPEGS